MTGRGGLRGSDGLRPRILALQG